MASDSQSSNSNKFEAITDSIMLAFIISGFMMLGVGFIAYKEHQRDKVINRAFDSFDKLHEKR